MNVQHKAQPKALTAFIRRVEAYLRHTGMQAANFGKASVNDPNFVLDLRAGKRQPRLSTMERVDQFMRDNPDGPAPKEPPASAGEEQKACSCS
jgi:hypothetical protein